MFLKFARFCRKHIGDCLGMVVSGLILMRLSQGDEGHEALLILGVFLVSVGFVATCFALKKGLSE